MHMHMVFADHAFQYSHIFAIADLHDQISAPHFDFTLQHVVSAPELTGAFDRDHVFRFLDDTDHVSIASLVEAPDGV